MKKKKKRQEGKEKKYTVDQICRDRNQPIDQDRPIIGSYCPVEAKHQPARYNLGTFTLANPKFERSSTKKKKGK